MSTAHLSESLLELDPDLGQWLSAGRSTAAGQELRVRIAAVKAGEWRFGPATGSSVADIGVLIVDGVVSRELRVHDAPSAELFGTGDIIRTAATDAPLELLRCTSRWRALTPLTIAFLDARTALALRQYPEISAVVFDRFNARGQRLAVTQAISQITGVDTRRTRSDDRPDRALAQPDRCPHRRSSTDGLIGDCAPGRTRPSPAANRRQLGAGWPAAARRPRPDRPGCAHTCTSGSSRHRYRAPCGRVSAGQSFTNGN
jgi:hypothetical protein